MVAGCNKLNKL